MKESVLIAVFTTAGQWAHPAIVQFAHAAASERDRRSSILSVHGVVPVSAARSRAARRFLESGYDWLLLLDHDVTPPMGLLSVVDAAEGRDVLACRYLSRGVNFVTPCWELGKLRHDPWPWIELARAGTGAMFIRRRVFEAMPPPWFAFQFDENGELIESEDYLFCDRARAAGFRVWGYDDPAFGCGHVKPLDLSALEPTLRKLADTPFESENELRWLDADTEILEPRGHCG